MTAQLNHKIPTHQKLYSRHCCDPHVKPNHIIFRRKARVAKGKVFYTRGRTEKWKAVSSSCIYMSGHVQLSSAPDLAEGMTAR